MCFQGKEGEEGGGWPRTTGDSRGQPEIIGDRVGLLKIAALWPRLMRDVPALQGRTGTRTH